VTHPVEELGGIQEPDAKQTKKR